MDFEKFFSGLLATIYLFLRRIVLLVFLPYKTMRHISEEKDFGQIILIFITIAFYFFLANGLREYDYEPFVLFLMTVFHYIATVIFFYLFTMMIGSHDAKLQPFLFTFAYALIPTILWFSTNSVLYAVLPPPRTLSILGKAFSILFITFSTAVLMWKIILMYLAIRFSTKLNFFQIVYVVILYLIAILPYSIFLYSLRFFRIPFL
ncbi:hypothetical protein A3A93_01785 [Candidatus Roizmanbacteria bacterium RIFCSPLOWO2_01_FULL_38_12]|uniref:Yip1 domain-containing protein n=1 Tax=Candidatus Roizmanbacteria bacterium RIFCSPLOWO2_01_FULL_38_12 TaxID=1802061 RepID=A0A1F7IYA0_9BACT|nr:MAG: hypothetical protein A2861_02210 [Candidatus Roizmanbacteria bacterium RIFCSPHIGHO2_01_FULL_38_15]OGK34519.1 MAG: hypothetical protein A3F59_04315 [Candidatus Roizmanbacteria bacterium RIFCSPHIGHO2_12_FULL_38_13]OGK48348.1 MAG: hypothetical protein A3A93_01785 [Candidatus Roizmanbacteria bacterium RIFCSPLOWO2_01_FULL_38_12]